MIDPVTGQIIRTFISSYAVPTLHLVADTLDKDGLPVANTSPSGDCLFSRAIDRWFRPWKSKGGLDTIPNYVYDTVSVGRPYHPLGDGIVNPTTPWLQVNYDTAYKNIQFNDSLTFNQIITKSNDTVYELRSDAFYPLDNRGFGAEIGTRNWSYYLPRNAEEASWVLGDLQAGAYRQTMNDLTSRVVTLRNAGGTYNQPADIPANMHNFSFAMKMVQPFIYKKAINRPSGKEMYFSFRGDDDVWVFVNGRLALDLGGLHDPVEKFVDFDSLSLLLGNPFHLIDGDSSKLEFFICERQADGSDCQIMFNALSPVNASSQSLFTVPKNNSSQIKISSKSQYVKISLTTVACDPELVVFTMSGAKVISLTATENINGTKIFELQKNMLSAGIYLFCIREKGGIIGSFKYLLSK